MDFYPNLWISFILQYENWEYVNKIVFVVSNIFINIYILFPQSCQFRSLNEFSQKPFQMFSVSLSFLEEKYDFSSEKYAWEWIAYEFPQNYFHATAQAMNYTPVYLKLDRFIEICMSLYACNTRSIVSVGLVLDFVRHIRSCCRV